MIERLKRMVRALRPGRPPQPGHRSVVFYQHCYYHHYYLAQALRRRGWDALMVSIEDPEGPNKNYYHGEDLNLFDPDPVKMEARIQAFYDEAIERFRLMHFAGDGHLSFFPSHFPDANSPDFRKWHAVGNKIAYTTSGCNSGIAQSSLMAWSRLAPGGGPVCCDKCPWQDNDLVCSDERNLGWARRASRQCDVIFADTAPGLDLLALPKTIRDPISSALDPEIWRPDLVIPAEFRVEREPGEILVYHSFGNYEHRGRGERNVKGTPAVFEAIERLKSEGRKVRLIFVTGMRNLDVRYIQLQADIVVDQLNFGRYGAMAKEAMMLGKPVICYVNPLETRPGLEVPAMKELPLVSATEDSLYEVLKGLIDAPERRAVIGAASRAYMLKWHSADACAERYERVYDALMAGELKKRRPVFT
jgi:glycosyltransferase involved in cell wall biosynthesis